MFSFRTLVKKVFLSWRKKDGRLLVNHHHDLKLLQRAKGRFFPRWRQFFNLQHILNTKEKIIIKFAFTSLIVGLVWLGLVFAWQYRVEVPAVGGKITEAVVGSPQFINPIFSSTNDADMSIVRLVYSGLMRFDEKNRLVTDLAVSYEISEDQKIYTFILRQGVVWHDNTPFTAEDMVFTIDTIQNSLTNSPLYLAFQGVEAVALDDYTIRFILPEVYPTFLSILTVGIMPEHVWFNIPPEQMRLAQNNWQPIGTGPFSFARLTKDESGKVYVYELKRFANYYRQAPFLEEFVFHFYNEYEGETGAVQALRSQKIDAISFVPKNLRDKIERKHIVLRTLQIPQYSALFFNQQNTAVLKDKNVRLALATAIEKERILREAVRGEGQIINSPILPGMPGYDSERGQINYNVSEANSLLDKNWPSVSAEEYRQAQKEILLKELLAQITTSTEETVETVSTSTEMEAEIDKKLDQEINQAQTFYRRNKDGVWLEINLVTVGTEEYKQASAIVAGFWQEIGVKTNIRYVAPRDLNRDVLRNRSYDVLLYGVITGSDPDQFPFWHSSQISYPGFNLSGYVNRNADTILTKVRGAVTEEEKVELYNKFQDLLFEDLPAVFLYMPTYTYALSDKIQGVGVEKISQPADRFSGVINWYIKTSWQWKK